MIARENFSKSLFSAMSVLASMFAVGCGGPYDSYVSGVVSLDGSPLSRGTVSYNPTSAGPSSYAPIMSDGSYVIRTGREEGLPSGEYVVTVVSKEDAVPDTSGTGRPPTPGKDIAPEWYASLQHSTLKYSVESGSNELNLELTSEPPPNWNKAKKRRR